MFPICKQPETLDSISKPYRWFIFVVGVVEVSLWSGTIFGWASIVHVLKTQGIYSHLCYNETVNMSLVEYAKNHDIPINFIDGNSTNSSLEIEEVTLNCQQQDDHYANVGTIAMVLYSLFGVPVGYALHHWGLGFTRIISSLMISAGFTLLSVTTKESSDFLWGASILLSVGGNTLRVACLELANLFPQRRYTAMAIIGGTYTLSGALFMLVQLATEAGFQWKMICYTFIVASSLSLPLTILMPQKHIPYGNANGGEQNADDPTETTPLYSSDDSRGLPLRLSIISVSSWLHLLWLFTSLFTVHVYSIDFNSWITGFATPAEVANYSRHYGYANLCCLLVIPLPGLLVDALYNTMKIGKVGVDTRVARIQAMILPLSIVTVVNIIQMACFFFSSSWAVYVSLVCLVINRPSCWGVGALFIRARFPVDHFNRIIGIYGTVMAVLTLFQCLHFKWLQYQFHVALGVLLVFILLSIINPLHLLYKTHLRTVINQLHMRFV